MKTYTIHLYNRDGNSIDTREEIEGLKRAKDHARYMLSDEFARRNETTHAAWETMKAAIFAEGQPTGADSLCEWDEFHPQHETAGCPDGSEDIPAGNLADDDDARHLGDENQDNFS